MNKKQRKGLSFSIILMMATFFLATPITAVAAPLTGDDRETPWLWALALIVAIVVCIVVAVTAIKSNKRSKKRPRK